MNYPAGLIAPYPLEEPKFVISLSYARIPRLKRIGELPTKVIRSDFESQTITFSGEYYRSGMLAYEYTPRSVDAAEYMQRRRDLSLLQNMSDLRAQALTKDQKQKQGGLLSLNIPIKSKVLESIAGEGGAGLKVSGYHQITFSGRSQWDDRASTATYRQSKFPSLNMEQISRFDINGTIGTKISVSVTQDSQTDIPLANRIMLRYKGDEDDIIKSIEAGNTTLSLPNTQFVGYSSRIQGLFGIKTTAQIGNLTMTAIASQEKGTTERNSIIAGASARKDYIRDYNYASGRIFDLGRKNSQGFFVDFFLGDAITYIDVYTGISQYSQTTTGINANLYVDPDDTTEFANEKLSALVNPTPVDRNTYYVDVKNNWILFDNANISYGTEIGVYMIIKRANGTIDTVGNVGQEPYALKLIRHKNPDSTQVTWDYMWRNVYYLNATNIDVSGLEIRILKGAGNTERSEDNLDHQDGIPYIRLMGLDSINQAGQAMSDGLADVQKPSIVDPVRGLLIFPDRKPFASNKPYYDTLLLKDQVPEIYSYQISTQEVIKASKYYIEVSNRSRATEISLGRPNIIENSERITLNGRLLNKGTDYNIQYDFGLVTFLTEEALDPNANISIDYEYTPFIAAEKKTLFGIRGEYEFSSNFKLGATYLYKSDKATDRKPKVGQETTRSTIWDADASYKFKPNFLSKAINLLPFYSTTSESNLAISGEMAQSHPNPNVDGVAYIDDFEGSRDSYSLGIFRELWTLSSRPAGLDTASHRARLVWYNPYDQVATNDIWNRELKPGESGTHTLWVRFEPGKLDRRAGEYSSNITYDSLRAWNGLMRYMPAGSANQDAAQLLELRIQGEKGIVHFEMGIISEDVNGNDSLDTEDKRSIGGFYNNILDEGEDVGLDGRKDSDEPGYDPVTNPDPNGDNWYYNGEGAGCNGCDPYDYEAINGTEGNAKDPNRWGKPDSEDIYRNNVSDKANNYFSFELDLANPGGFYVDSSEFNGWKTYRIPIKDTAVLDTIVGSPSWSQINYVRVWFESPTGEVCQINFATMDFIQSNWDDKLKPVAPLQPTTSRFNVAVINNQENIDYRLDPPPGVSGYYDKTNQVTEPEQSLLLHYENFKALDTGLVERVLFDAPNYVGYRRLNMLVHGAPGVDSVMFFFRLGQDSNNYYEYQTMLQPGWNSANEVNIDFDRITGLKEFMMRSRDGSVDRPYDTTDGNYRIFGLPNLTRVKYLACGVVNLDTAQTPTGDVWVNELKLIDVRRDVGTAARVSASGNIADLISYGVTYSYRDAFFREISSSTRGGSSGNLGSGRSTTSYGFNVNIGLEKFLPRSLNASLPLSLRYGKTTEIPLLRFNTDIVLPEELRDDESNINVSKGFTISESFNKRSSNPLFSILLNKLRMNYSYNKTEGKSPKTPVSFNENYHLSGRYDFSFGKIPSIKPFFWTEPVPLLKKLSGSRFYLLPNSFGSTADLDRNLTVSENTSRVRTESLRRDFRGNFRLGYKISDNMNATYSMDTKRDMSDPRTVVFSLNPGKFRLGRETNYNESFGISYSPTIFSFLTHKMTFSTGYREDIKVNDVTRNAAASKSYGVGGDLNLKKLFGDPGSRPQRSRARTKEAEDAQKKKSSVGKGLEPLAKLMRFLTGWINPISYDFNERYGYSYTGLLERAQLKFRFGLSEDIGAEVDSNATTTGYSTAVSKSTGYSFGSGTVFFGGLRTDVSYSRKIDQDIVKSFNPQKSIQTTFPDIRFAISPFKTFTLLNPIIKRFNPRTGYTRSTSEVINKQTGKQASERVTIAQRPLLSVNFDILKGVQINVNTDRSVTDEKIFNSQSGAMTSRQRSVQTNYNFSTKYSFSAPTGIKIPLFGRLKFSSTMSLAVDVTMRKQKTESANGENPLASSGERSDLMVTPNISYSFSSQIRGGLSARWQDTNDVALQRKSHIRELRIWVDIRF
ncbi:MAG: cell surface protein SprA [Candidatus Zixiibacteriota bacterium]